MKPVNSKSLLSFVFGQMEALDKGEIDERKAREQSNLIKQANNILKYELDRANTLMKLSQHNNIYKENIHLRDVESKRFE